MSAAADSKHGSPSQLPQAELLGSTACSQRPTRRRASKQSLDPEASSLCPGVFTMEDGRLVLRSCYSVDGRAAHAHAHFRRLQPCLDPPDAEVWLEECEADAG